MILSLVSGCAGNLRLSGVIDLLAQAHEAPSEALGEVLVPAVDHLVERGILVPCQDHT